MTAPRHEPVADVHEETARLFATLEGAAAAWARGGARDDAHDAQDERGGAGPGPGGAAHLPTTCGVCPLCLALDRLGRSRPEVVDHLADAVQALGAALAAVTGSREAPAGERAAGERDAPEGPARDPARTESIEVTD